MELREAFTGRWIFLIIAVPALTALIAGILFLSVADDEFEASAVLSVREFAATDAPANIRSVIDDFDSALRGRQVAIVVAESDPDVADNDGIALAVLGGGGDVRVSYVAADPDVAVAALDSGVREGLTLVSESERRRVARQLSAAETVSTESIDRLLEIENLAGAANLNDEVARRSGDILSLRNQIASAAGEEVQDALQETLTDKETELAAIELQLLPWTNTKARLDLAVSSAADASLRLQQIATSQEALRTDEVLQSLRVDELSKLPGLARVSVAGAIGTGLIIAFVALIPGGRSSARRVDTRPPSDP